MKAFDEIFKVFARDGIDDADAIERDVQFVGDNFYFFMFTEQNGHAEPERVKLPRRLQNARLIAFGENDPLGMPLQFFDDVADETHGEEFQVSSSKFQVESALISFAYKNCRNRNCDS